MPGVIIARFRRNLAARQITDGSFRLPIENIMLLNTAPDHSQRPDTVPHWLLASGSARAGVAHA